MRIGLLLIGAFLTACGGGTRPDTAPKTALPIVGTWRLISGTTVENGDTTVTDYTKHQSFIKLINDTHFAFLKHDLTNGRGASATYDSGGGTYSLRDSLYTEHLDYCTEREWEGHAFPFIITLRNDTLTQRGIEKVADVGINRLNIERYVRVSR